MLGLDSFTANNLVETLSNLAKRGRTVFISIHQPRSDIYKLFDSIILLSKGRMIYSGTGRDDMIRYFDKLGYQVPMHANPADFFIDVVSVDNRDELSEKKSIQEVDLLIEAWREWEFKSIDSNALGKHQVSDTLPNKNFPEELTGEVTDKLRSVANIDYFQQTWILLRRAICNLKRDNLAIWGTFFEVLFVGSIMGAIFFKLDESIQGVLTRRSALYIVASMQTYLLLIFIIYKLSNDMKIFDRERADNMYATIPYMVSQFLSTLPFNILFPLIYSSILVILSLI